MPALDAPYVAAGRHLLAPKARRVSRHVNRQPIFVESFVAMKTGQWHLGGWDEPEIIFVVMVHRVGVLRQMPSAGDRLAIDHQRRNYLEVPLLLSLDIEHPRDQRAFEPRTRAAQDIETRPGEFHAAIEIDDPEILAEFPMRERLERGELERRPFGFYYAVVGLAFADRHIGARNIRQLEHQRMEFAFRQSELRSQLEQRIAGSGRQIGGCVGENLGELLFVRFLGANSCDLGGALVWRELADLARASLAVGSQLIDFSLKLSALLIGRD